MAELTTTKSNTIILLYIFFLSDGCCINGLSKQLDRISLGQLTVTVIDTLFSVFQILQNRQIRRDFQHDFEDGQNRATSAKTEH